MSSENWGNVLQQALLAASRGRGVLMKYLGRLEKVEHKFQAGLVSEADRESEKAIFDFLRKEFYQAEFLGEESSVGKTKVQEPTTEGQGRWIVDPLDGTTNYIHQLPVFCISIAYEFSGCVQVAVVDVPMMEEVYTAIRGQGAYLNGKRLKVSEAKTIQDAFLATGFAYDLENCLDEQLGIFSKLVREAQAIRRLGAAAYDLCLVARGVFDGYWERGLQPWDSAAGALIVREAGGVVQTYRGQDYDPYKNSIVAGNKTMVELLTKSMSGLIYPSAH